MQRRRLKIGWVLIFAGAIVLGVLLWLRHEQFRRGDEAISAAIVEIERTDPRWRWADILAARPEVPDQENMAPLAQQLDTVPTGIFGSVFDDWCDLWNGLDGWPMNELPPDRWLCEAEAFRPLLTRESVIADQMVDRGGFWHPMTASIWNFPTGPIDGVRSAANYLKFDSILQAARTPVVT